jgi:hypothetical protein
MYLKRRLIIGDSACSVPEDRASHIFGHSSHPFSSCVPEIAENFTNHMSTWVISLASRRFHLVALLDAVLPRYWYEALKYEVGQKQR